MLHVWFGIRGAVYKWERGVLVGSTNGNGVFLWGLQLGTGCFCGVYNWELGVMAGLVRLVGISKETLHRPGGASKLNFWTACKNLDINYIFGILTSRAFDWYMYGSNGRGGGGGGSEFFRPPLSSSPPSKRFIGPLLRNLKISSKSLAQAQSIGTLFEQIGLRGGSGHVQKSEAHVLGCRPRGESSR